MTSEQQEKESTKARPDRLSIPRLLLIGGILLVLIVALGFFLSHIPVTQFQIKPRIAFDFDTSFPLLAETQNTPFNQTSNGITAYFSAPSDTAVAPAFSIQSYDTTFIKLSKFSGKYIYDNKASRDILEIRFSQQLKSVSLTFATVEYRTETSNITLTAYLDSTNTAPLGSTTARATFQKDLYPQGTLSFDSDNQPFNLVRIEISSQEPGGATNFFVDNITVVTVEQEQ